MKAINCTVTSQDTGTQHAHILLEGELTLGSSKEVLPVLIEAIGRYDVLEIDIKNIVNMDLTGIQLLYAIKKTAAQKNKPFTCHITLAEELKTIMDHSGFADLAAQLSNTI